MKIAFVFPFLNNQISSPTKLLPLSAATLIGNLKDDFPSVRFTQIFLEEELADLHSIKKDFETARQILLDSERIFSPAVYRKLEPFLEVVVRQCGLTEYDHFFLSFYSNNDLGIRAHLYLAKYLKKKFKGKKIIMGGAGASQIAGRFSRELERFDFLDSLVVGYGEIAGQEILKKLIKGKKLKKIYPPQISPERLLKGLPDFSSFRNLDLFRYSGQETINLKGSKADELGHRLLLLPYFFSVGCFWGKCAFCAYSGLDEVSFKRKEIPRIIQDIKELKRRYGTRHFIFFNNNFNSNLGFAKQLLKEFIKSKLNILWTDSFNIVLLDDELLDLMVKAGCYRMDIGTTILDPVLQKQYSQFLSDNEYLNNLKKIDEHGIWTNINLITGMPHQYSIKKEKAILEKHMAHIDNVSLNPYYAYLNSDMTRNSQKYGFRPIEEKIEIPDLRSNFEIKLPFLEKEYKGTLEERKKEYVRGYTDFRGFFQKNKKIINNPQIHLLAYLYEKFGHKKKREIRNIALRAAKIIS